jgi:hypothetical protein
VAPQPPAQRRPVAGRRFAPVCCAVCLLAVVACSRAAVTVEFRDPQAFSATDRQTIEAIADRATRDVRRLLPALPSELRLTVQPGTTVIPETGESAEFGLPGAVYWTVDPRHRGGIAGVASAQLRATLFHEYFHLIREPGRSGRSLVDAAVNEGLATVFEREFGGAPTPWGSYPADVAGWAQELLALPNDAPREHWMFRHPDGRRWIGYKVGTYLVDRAVRRSGRSIVDLAGVPTETILAWAEPG